LRLKYGLPTNANASASASGGRPTGADLDLFTTYLMISHVRRLCHGFKPSAKYCTGSIEEEITWIFAIRTALQSDEETLRLSQWIRSKIP